MTEPTSRYREIFFEVFEALPRQGPGNRECAAKALSLCRDLPSMPVVLDMGCGVGGQTLHIAELTSGSIIAVDNHAPSIVRLNATITARGLTHRVKARVADMADMGFPSASFDLIWAEGSLYNLGIENALKICHPLLRIGGHLAFTDAVWRKENPPPEVRATFDLDYPTMGRAPDVMAVIADCSFELLGHFTLPDEAWWDEFYTPMLRRIKALRGKYAGDDETSALLDQIEREPELHRKYSDYYAYEFFVACRLE